MIAPQPYPEVLNILRELDEWMALGFCEVIDMPWPRSFGRAFRRLYENMEIHIPEERLLLPCEPFPCCFLSTELHHATGFICDFMHDCGIHTNGEVIAQKKQEFPQYADFIDELASDLRSRLPYFGDYTHSNPDIRRVVTEGFGAMERELDEQIAAVDAQEANANAEEGNLLAALKDYAIGVRAFHARTVTVLKDVVEKASGQRKVDLALIANAFENCFMVPCSTFVQGLLAVHFSWLLDGCDSIGRVDQVLWPLFEKDTSNGTIDIELARRLIDEFFLDFEQLNGWNFQIGGYRPDGVDGYTELTHEFILACRRNKIRRPNVAFRITEATPDEALIETIDVLREGTGRPALYNDDLYVETLLGMDLGLTPEDARDLGFGGCTEIMIPGMSNVGCTGFCSSIFEGEDMNLAKVLEWAIYDGYDPAVKRQVGPHTGRLETFAEFDAFAAAVNRQIQYATDVFATELTRALHERFTQGDPKLFRTFFTRDCVRKRKTFEAGGARYNWSVVNYAGVANMIDGLAAIRKCIFDDKSVSVSELLTALQADFEGYEDVQRKLLAAPKFGNDEPYVDDLGREIMKFAWRELLRHEHPRGGRYLPACLMFATYGAFGSYVGALPDGRKAGTPLTDSIGPFQGRDTHGPTAMLKSVAKLPLSLAIGTPVLNIRFQKKLLSTRTGLEACANLVRSFFDMGGMQIQFSVVSKEDMLAAQKEPDKYRDLIIRIGGYSEYFTRLDSELQDSVIARTEHG